MSRQRPSVSVGTKSLLAAATVVLVIGPQIGADDEATGPPVFGVHDMEMADDVDKAELDKFLIEEFARAWAEPRDGLQLIVQKGDRGDRKGEYRLIYRFDSVKTRDRHFPNGNPSSDFQAAAAPVQDVSNRFFRRIKRRIAFTDYEPLSGTFKTTKEAVYGVHDIELDADANPEDFHKFVKEEFAPAWREFRDGVRLAFLKGSRGRRQGRYQLVYLFDSVKSRDKHFPRDGGEGSDAFQKAVEPVAEVMQSLDRFGVRSVGYSDFVSIRE